MKPSVAAREAVTKRESEGRSSSPPKPRSSRGGMLPLRPLGASLSYLRKETLRSEGWGEGEGAPLSEVLRLFLLECLAHLLAAAPAQLDLGQGWVIGPQLKPRLGEVLAERHDLDGAEGARELLEHDRVGLHPRQQARPPPAAHGLQGLLGTHLVHLGLGLRLDKGRHSVGAAHAVGRQLARLDAARREHEQGLRAADEAELLDERLVGRQPLLAIENARLDEAGQRAEALLEDAVHAERPRQPLTLVRQPAVALQQPRLAAEEHVLELRSVGHVEHLDVIGDFRLPVPVGQSAVVVRVVPAARERGHSQRGEEVGLAAHRKARGDARHVLVDCNY
eukprot:scaffold9594_cov56-Phaeocystis_antarctica.AAC.5